MDDDFIDDDGLDEYFERNGRKDKLGGSGGDRFYVNKGDLEFVDDGTGAANALRRAFDGTGAGVGGAGAALRCASHPATTVHARHHVQPAREDPQQYIPDLRLHHLLPAPRSALEGDRLIPLQPSASSPPRQRHCPDQRSCRLVVHFSFPLQGLQ